MRYMTIKRTGGTKKTAKSPESLSLLAGGIAHDINNTLAAILGNIEILQMYAKKEDRLMIRLDKAERAVVQAKNLTQQLLNLSINDFPTRQQVANNEK